MAEIKKITWLKDPNIQLVQGNGSNKASTTLLIKNEATIKLLVTEIENPIMPVIKVYWYAQRESDLVIVFEKETTNIDFFNVKIPKKYCGGSGLIISARTIPYPKITKLNTKYNIIRDFVILGQAPQRIINSAWSIHYRGKDVRKTHNFLFSDPLYLNLKTEGINGSPVDIEIYWNKENAIDPYITTYKNAKVIDGEINYKITDAHKWFKKMRASMSANQLAEANKENIIYKFYVKVKWKGIKTSYIIDNNNDSDHARFLRIRSTLFDVPNKPTNTTPTTIGKPDTNPGKVAPCNFKEIVIYENGEPVKIFNQGAFISKISGKDHFYTIKEIHYDYDQSYIREDAKPILNEIAEFLKENPFLPVQLGSHTDIRGKDEYNLILSRKRAQSAVDYLIAKGVSSNRISAIGHGKTMLIHKGEDVTEAQHQENRRTTLKFLIYGSEAQTMVVETTTPSYAQPKDYKVLVNDWLVNKCYRDKDKHERMIKVREESVLHTNKISTIASGAAYPVYSIVKNDFIENYFLYLLKYLNPVGNVTNSFFFYIHSCAYYASKNQPTLQLKTYPDIIWVGHFQYNYKDKGSYFFHNKAVQLNTGINEVIDEYINSTYFKILKIIPSTWLQEYILFPYIKSQAEDYSYAAHVFYEREAEAPGTALSFKGKEVNLITQTKYTKYAAAAAVYAFVCVGIVIDLLMIYLTRGRNLTGKVASLAKKVKKAKKFLEDNNLELYPPSIAINGGMYYYMDERRRMSLIYEANIKANPLVAIEFEKEIDLLNDFFKGSSNKAKQTIANDLQENGVFSVKATVEVRGDLIFEDTVKYSILTQTYSFAEQVQNILQLNNTNERLINRQITFKVSVDGEFKQSFEFWRIRTDIEGKLTINMEGGAALKLEYGVEKEKGLFVQETLVFSGIKGIYSGMAKAKTKVGIFDFDIFDKEIEPTPFTLLEAKDYSLFKVHLFNQPK